MIDITLIWEIKINFLFLAVVFTKSQIILRGNIYVSLIRFLLIFKICVYEGLLYKGLLYSVRVRGLQKIVGVIRSAHSDCVYLRNCLTFCLYLKNIYIQSATKVLKLLTQFCKENLPYELAVVFIQFEDF